MSPHSIIRWLEGDAVLAPRRSDDFLEAKQIAAAQLAVHNVRKGATSAIVCDEQATEYLRIPSDGKRG